MQEVKLRVVLPPDKNFMIGFDGPDKRTSWSYNKAIEAVMKENDLHPFHQVGTDPFSSHSPGYHAWEVWVTTTYETLESLFPEIHSKASENYENYALWGMDQMPNL